MVWYWMFALLRLQDCLYKSEHLNKDGMESILVLVMTIAEPRETVERQNFAARPSDIAVLPSLGPAYRSRYS